MGAVSAFGRPGATDMPPDRYAVVGHPVAHSRSPWIHARFAAKTGQHLHYGRLDCPPDDFGPRLRSWEGSSETGFGPVRGCNITVPFKFAALALAERRSARAVLAGAANVLSFDGADGWVADNTDGVGLVRDIVHHAGVRIAGARVLLIGAGGAAAGALGPLIEAGPGAVHVVNRTSDRAEALIDRHASLAAKHGVALSAAGLDAAGADHDIVVNASASSLYGAGSPVAASVLRPGTLALDMMYGPAAAPFLDWAVSHGARPRDGLGMLVEQAAAAFFLWRGVMPLTDDVLAELRAQVAAT